MYRRDLLKAAGGTAGAALLYTDAQPARAHDAASARHIGGPCVRTRDGTDLFYRDWGAGAPVLFMSGWGLPSDIWAYQMAPLCEKNLRCLAYDRRGHGRSSDPGHGYTYDTLADDLAEVLEALDLRDVTCVAHSMAGGEVVRYLTHYGSKRIADAGTLGFADLFTSHVFGVKILRIHERHRH